MTITLIILSVVFAILSGLFKAICDLSEEGNLKFYKKTFWLKDLSWQNKWKNGDKKQGEKFFGSSRWFISLTDAWHVFGYIFRASYAIAFLAIGSLALYNPLLPLLAIPAYAFFALIFHIFHTYKILRK